ncbi:autotransporter assembly complex protein TamA [Salipiger bermudensis]|uniref:autotransporter assembly complex protein TamA n=1 Tax=Salipiger bermudensis TaxID=344736 RepID=UPI001C99140A|nr:autotransporter assembly complex family protein [Salipiger bermudensis]MBY6002746.1 autotransporter assembly complex protein TamA [Salipiger bermudensis]
MTIRRFAAASGTALCLASTPAFALENLNFSTPGMDEDLRAQMRNNSALASVEAEAEDAPPTGQDVLAAALSDYGILLETLYANGYYGGVISIRIDGREAADIPLLQTPDRVDTVVVSVQSGPAFTFGRAEIAPLAPETELPEGFKRGETAEASLVGDAADAGIDGWRQIGHAKAEISYQNVVADHRNSELDVEMRIAPGRELRFGRLITVNDSAVRTAAQRRIAGFPNGERFDPDELEEVERRLTRTGAFTSVTLREAEEPNPDGTLDVELRVVDNKPRRFGFGAEISSLEGLSLTAFWLHRNLWGGAERLRIDGEVTDIGASGSDALDASITARLEIPAAIAELGPNTDAFFEASLSTLNEPTYSANTAELTAGLTRRFNEDLTGEIGVGLLYSETEDDLGEREFLLFTLPLSLTWDKRDIDLDPTSGWYLDAELTPFYNLDGEGHGARLYTDLRGYYGFGESKSTVLAGRLQLGSVVGAELEDTQPEFLFYSGGAGTVRGQPYQSLTVDLDGDETGGRSFLGLSTELRQDINDTWGVVAFADAGYISEASTPGTEGDWHAGAGLGVRYSTPIGPLRVDLASPVSGDTGDGVQLYIGIGQAF